MKKLYLLIAAVILTAVGLVSMGNSRNTAVTMATSIIAKDKVGDSTTADIQTLTDYVHSHTRTSVSFTLDGSYGRAVTAAQQAAAGGSGNASVYSAATTACTQRDPVKTASCITAYVQSHTTPGTQPKAVSMPDKAGYTHNLEAPPWAPDLAGLAFAAAFLLIVATVFLSVLGLGKPH